MKWRRRRADEPSAIVNSVVFDLIEQPLFVFSPEFDASGSVSDVRFVEMNLAARDDLGIAAVPTGDSVRGWLTDLDTLWAAAEQAWREGRAEPYDLVVQRGRRPDVVRSYTIDTARDGDLLVQVAAPRTDARLLQDERDRFAATLDALDDGVVVLRPISDGTQVLDARIEFVSAACSRFFSGSLLPVGRRDLRGLGVGEIVQSAEVAEAIVGAVAAAAAGEPASMVLDNSTGSFPLLAQPSVRLAFHGQSAERVIMVVQDVSLSTYAEHQSTVLVDFGRSVVDAVDTVERPAIVVRVTPSDVAIDQASPSVRDGIARPVPCALAEACVDDVAAAETTTVFRRVADGSETLSGVELPGFVGSSSSVGSSNGDVRWTLAPLPGRRVFAVADRPVVDR